MHNKKSKKNIDIKQSRNNSSSRKIRGDSSGAVVSGLLHSNKMKELFCPKIVLNGWWWKKYVKQYQILSKLINDINRDNWVNKGGYEEYIKRVDDFYIKGVIDNSFKTNYTDNNE